MARGFVRETLGPWSSHPRWRVKQCFRWEALALVPLVLIVVVALAGFLVKGGGRGLAFLFSPSVVVFVLCGLAFAVATAVTLLLCAVLSRVYSLREIPGGSGADLLGTRHIVVTVIATLVAALIPVFVMNMPGVSAPVRMLCHYVPVLSLLGILIAMSMMAGGKDPKGQERIVYRRRPFLLGLLIIAAGLLLLTLLHDLGIVYRNSVVRDLAARLIPWYARLELLFGGFVVLLPLCVVLGAMWSVCKVCIVPQSHVEDVPPEDEEEPPRGLWQRIKAFFARLFGRAKKKPAPQPEPEDRPPEPPEWLSRLLDWLGEVDCRVATPPEQVAPSEVSAVEENRPELRFFFAGLAPTGDQAGAFDRFVESHRNMLAQHGMRRAPGDDVPTADMIVEGDVGSGRSTLVRACALYASLVRGQRCLLLMADDEAQRHSLKRLRDYLGSISLGNYVTVSELTADGMDAWLEGERPVPQITVATLERFETLVYGAEWAAGERWNRLDNLIRLYEVVLVDEILDYAEAQRSHLPFTLDKHRLVLDSDSIPLQLVIVAPRLTEIARGYLGLRFFGVAGMHGENNVREIRPRPGKRAWHVAAFAPLHKVGATIDRLVGWCLSHGINTVLYRSGLDEDEKRRQEQHFLEGSGDRGSIRIISSPDDVVDKPEDVQAVFYQIAVGHDICLALQLEFGNGDTVIFSLAQEGDVPEVAPKGVLPVIAERGAEPLVVRHLESAMRFLPVAAPIPSAAWYQFGIPFRDLTPATLGPRSGAAVRFDIDSWGEEAYGESLGEYASIMSRVGHLQRVKATMLPSVPERLLRIGEYGFVLGIPSGPSVPVLEMPRAKWVTESGQELQPADLTRLKAYRLVFNHQTYVVDTMRVRRDRKGLIELSMKLCSGRGDDGYIPLVDIQWKMPHGQRLDLLNGGSDYGVSWFNMDLPHRVPCVPVHTCVRGRLSDYGYFTPQRAVEYDYPALFSGLIFDPFDLDAKALDEAMGEALVGEWQTDTGHGFSAALTGAMNYAFQIRVPGLPYFARALAFSLKGNGRTLGPLVAWIVEPAGTGRTAMSVLRRVLDPMEDRKGFFESVLWFLDHLREKDTTGRALFARRYARCGFSCDGEISDAEIEEAAALVGRIVHRVDIMLGLRKPTPRVRPLPPNPLPVDPRPPDPHPSPTVWNPEGEVTPWAECLKRLWEPAVERIPEIQHSVLSEWRYHVRFEMDLNGAEPRHIQILRERAAQIGLSCLVREHGLCLGGAGETAGSAFRGQLDTLLPAVSGLRADLHGDPTVLLHLWLANRDDDHAGRRPLPGDPVDLYLEGRLADDGLILEREVAPEPLPAIPPLPGGDEGGGFLLECEPTYPAPDDGGERQAMEWRAVDIGMPQVEDINGAMAFAWTFDGRDFTLPWGFPQAEDARKYRSFLDGLDARSSTGWYFSYFLNDPFLTAMHAVGDQLLALYGKPPDTEFAKYLLAFVQAFPYRPDPVKRTDWPLFPSEFLTRNGGDCEDSSILLAFLLAKSGIDFCFLNMPGHMAIGIAGPYEGAFYTKDRKRYYYAETATDACYHPLGLDGSLARKAELLPYFARGVGNTAPICILSGTANFGGNDTVECRLLSRRAFSEPCTVAVYSKPRSNQLTLQDGVSLVGSCTVDPPSDGNQACHLTIPVDHAALGVGHYCHDLVVFSGGEVVGRWYCLSNFTISM